MTTNTRTTCAFLGVAALMTAPVALADDDEAPFGAAVVIIELTDEDIELQFFADGFDWTRLEIFDPNERKVFDARARGRLTRQGGLSELVFASEPSHYLVDEDNFDEPVEAFLARWPEGNYEFEGQTTVGVELESEAYLSHVLPALPEITAPADGAEVDPEATLVIAWEPVTTRFIGDGPVDIIEYQVIVGQEEPGRSMPWINGGTRSALVNLPGHVTEFNMPPEMLEPGAVYEIEVLAIEANGNASIGVVEFETSD